MSLLPFLRVHEFILPILSFTLAVILILHHPILILLAEIYHPSSERLGIRWPSAFLRRSHCLGIIGFDLRLLLLESNARHITSSVFDVTLDNLSNIASPDRSRLFRKLLLNL